MLRGTRAVLAVAEKNPFPQKPLRHLRVVRYEYPFIAPATRAAPEQIRRRTPHDFYIHPASPASLKSICRH